MKLILEIQDNRAADFEEMVKEHPFIKTKLLSRNDEIILEEIAEIKKAMKNAKALAEGKLKSRPVEDLLGEL